MALRRFFKRTRRGFRGQEENKQTLIEDCKGWISLIKENYDTVEKGLYEKDEDQLYALREDLETEYHHSESLLWY